MSKLDPQEGWCDNVLLEWDLMLILYESSNHNNSNTLLRTIFPVAHGGPGEEMYVLVLRY